MSLCLPKSAYFYIVIKSDIVLRQFVIFAKSTAKQRQSFKRILLERKKKEKVGV